MMKSAKLTERFEQALVYAHRLHINQTRKVGNIPYIAHLLSVAALVLEAGGNEDEAISALLHDSIEDQGGAKTREEIRQQFGESVVNIVDGCTESETYPKPPWKERKLRYLAQIETASSSVQLVSLADKLHNGRSLLLECHKLGDEIWKFFPVGKAETLWFYDSLLQIYKKTPYLQLVQEFRQVVNSLRF
ncbi:HD domain-containing protein [Limnoraphis robusta CCNP1315]|uniref:HD domain-containing protein n=2 Tax=Limnoraphis TaxID=1332112 RepID=A0ABU5TTR0_9CYAN|nr:HD domain-containing protein [Limnoraphis robusta]MEA5518016.1 HD domain-containing protein [Limnoraphis robusta CCNP1315]MEA5547255.1 HD domain-containing protein [Limnoraphis robusta CCNP1324]